MVLAPWAPADVGNAESGLAPLLADLLGPDAGPGPQDADLVALDPACTRLDAAYVRRVLELARSTGHPHAVVRPVTDTVARVEVVDGTEVLRDAVPREDLVQLASPLVVPAALAARLGPVPDDSPDTAGDTVWDAGDLVSAVTNAGGTWVWLEGPGLAGRG